MKRSTTRDELLVVRCQLGEREAFDELVERWHPRLSRFAGRLADDAGAAEEVVQETWLRVVRGLPRLRRRDRLGAWIFGIAHRVATDRLRSKYSRRKALGERDDGDPDALEASDLETDRMLDRQSVERALDRLPLGEREVTILFYLEELSQAEIADALEVPEGTVKSRLHRSRRLLRDALRALGERQDLPSTSS